MIEASGDIRHAVCQPQTHDECAGARVADVQNVLGVLYSSTVFQGNFNYMTVLPVVAYERAVFYRERSASMYAAGPYSSATGETNPWDSCRNGHAENQG